MVAPSSAWATASARVAYWVPSISAVFSVWTPSSPGPLRHGLDLPGGRRTKHPLRRLGIGRQHGGQQAQSQQSGNKFSLHVCRFLPIGL